MLWGIMSRVATATMKGGSNMPEANNIEKAIRDAQQEHARLLETLKEYEKTRSRAAQLEAFINLGKALLEITTTKEEGKPESKPSSLPKEVRPTLTQPGGREIVRTLKDGVLHILRESGRALSLAELADEFHKRHWKLSEKNARQVLRGTVLRMPESLTKTMKGYTAYYQIKQG